MHPVMRRRSAHPAGARAARRWRPGWTMTVFVAVMLPVVVSLGSWQLDRAAEKRGYEQQQLRRLGMPPITARWPLEPPDFQRVRLRGRFEAGRDYLVDNRVHQGRPGYWVVSRFVDDEGRRWLVNRGWTAAPASRQALPRVETPLGPVELVGVLWPDTGLPPLLAADPWPDTWPKRVQRLDVARMAERDAAGAVDDSVVPVEVRLEAGQPGALVAAPQDLMFSPAKHLGYAVQWFALAAVLVVGYVIFGFKRGRDDHEP